MSSQECINISQVRAWCPFAPIEKPNVDLTFDVSLGANLVRPDRLISPDMIFTSHRGFCGNCLRWRELKEIRSIKAQTRSKGMLPSSAYGLEPDEEDLLYQTCIIRGQIAIVKECYPFGPLIDTIEQK